MADRLDAYRSKRDFAVTREPAGGAGGGSGTSRFVIQEHHARRLHWDLRLERDGVLASWAVPKGLPEEPGTNHFAARTEDHPLEYIDFHGEIPAGSYGAGTMTIWDHGTYETLKWEPRKVEVALHGERLEARYALFAIGKEDAPKDWMVHRMDPPADPTREPLPSGLVPMRALAGALPAGAGWAFEFRWTGARTLVYSEPGEVHFAGDERYPELGRLARALGSHSAVLDGVIVAFGPDGRPSPEILARRDAPARVRALAASQPVTFVIFDLLWLDGHPLLELPYAARRERLAGLRLEGERWRTPDYVVDAGADVLATSRAHGLAGVVAKRLSSAYSPGMLGGAWVEVVEPAGHPVGRPGYYGALAAVLVGHLGEAGLDELLRKGDSVELRALATDEPVAVVFDLVPAAPATIVECCDVALRLAGMFDHLGLRSFVKTSGAGGLQVYLPVAGATLAQTRAFARAVAELLARDESSLVVVSGSAPAGEGRVSVDWSQQPTLAPYSLLALTPPTVSTPLEWDEIRRTLDSGEPSELVFGPDEALARVARLGDLFAPMLSLAQALPA